MQLARVALRVRSPASLAHFYTDHLGMSARAKGHAVILGYGGVDAAIELRQATSGTSYAHARTDRYWKIGITLPNVDIAHAQLRQAGVTVSDPTQFNEIGYMCHLCDSAGFSIELLQHSFLGNRDDGDGDPSKPLGGGARIGQITLRVSDLSGALSFYRDRLGMKLLSVQAVREFGFVLYFLAFTDESPPNADLDVVENREWLWRRPYTTLELQYFPDRSSAFELPREGNPGFDGLIVFRGSRSSACLQDEAGGAVHLTR